MRYRRLTWGIEGGRTGLVSNARIETAAQKPTFAESWKRSRGVVPVDGWYEWKMRPDGRKQPYYFTLASEEPIWLTALIRGERYALVTSETSAELRAIHTRRPVAISADEARDWCEPSRDWTAEELVALIVPEEAYVQRPVSWAVNTTRNDGPDLVLERKEPPTAQPLELDLFPNPA